MSIPMSTDTTPIELPVLGSTSRPRADAVRNRALIMGAAERLFREKGVQNVSMDAIACAAGVGKGTLFRRFGDRGSLVRALLEEREGLFQETFIRGEPPLGPGAPAVERLIAFGHALLEFTACHGEFLLAAEATGPGVRFRTHVYAVHHAHVRYLVSAAAPEVDASYAADCLLSMLSADLVMHQLHGRGVPLEDLQAGWDSMVRSILG
jgi:AcrR family transcriptional regulator